MAVDLYPAVAVDRYYAAALEKEDELFELVDLLVGSVKLLLLLLEHLLVLLLALLILLLALLVLLHQALQLGDLRLVGTGTGRC